jgi:UDP-N-acetylglucosamine--N-acetylmuramyl-(pentapeptide) pyrophosphoryl-undecaprenol N-acetylglucosamine transferase
LPFGGKGLLKKGKALWHLARAYRKAVALLRRLRPNLVIGIGGYASVPTLVAAWRLGIPRTIIEQNAVPGRANRLLSRFSNLVFIHFKEAGAYFPREKTVQSGNPVRPAFRKAIEFTPSKEGGTKKVTLLVLGGSQGARAINRLLIDWTRTVPPDSPLRTQVKIIHQTGSADLKEVTEKYHALVWPAEIEAKAFLDPITPYYLQSDLVIARSGAGTLCELAACGKPAILIPYPYAADNHQEANARALEKVGGACILCEKDVTAKILDKLVSDLLQRPSTLRNMGTRARELDFPAAAACIWEKLLQIRTPLIH